MLFSALVADPHDITRKGTRQLIEDLGGRVVEEVQTASTAIEVLETVEVDLLVTELDLSSGNGLQVLAQIQENNLATVPLVLTHREHYPCVAAAFQLGAQGVTLKSDPPGAIEGAMRDVLAGRKHLSEDLPRKLKEGPSASDEKLFEKCLDGKPLSESDLEAAFDPIGVLTDRERQVLQLTAEGLTAEETGERLSISDRTVEKHRENVRQKLDFDNRLEMARFAFDHGLVSPEPSGDGLPAEQSQRQSAPTVRPAS
jgi:DNA-binding NarL/FixJ family response regulator